MPQHRAAGFVGHDPAYGDGRDRLRRAGVADRSDGLRNGGRDAGEGAPDQSCHDGGGHRVAARAQRDHDASQHRRSFHRFPDRSLASGAAPSNKPDASIKQASQGRNRRREID
ncbi:hypothetical protein [Croceibacterium ferulae]|uniref:hypothetical protein n=1 Tax=Croceibacterium ferulae TaxID=1854641 RepID=UPI000F86E096|nr:hypothetical protein [Croceibacterium ferulae]